VFLKTFSAPRPAAAPFERVAERTLYRDALAA
jgi:hypothetical protein